MTRRELGPTLSGRSGRLQASSDRNLPDISRTDRQHAVGISPATMVLLLAAWVVRGIWILRRAYPRKV